MLAVIAMRRAGRIQPAEVAGIFERLADAPFGTTITIERRTRRGGGGAPSSVKARARTTPLLAPLHRRVRRPRRPPRVLLGRTPRLLQRPPQRRRRVDPDRRCSSCADTLPRPLRSRRVDGSPARRRDRRRRQRPRARVQEIRARAPSSFNREIAKTGKVKKAFGGTGEGRGHARRRARRRRPRRAAPRPRSTEMKDAQKVSAQTAAALKVDQGRRRRHRRSEIDKLVRCARCNMSGVDDEAIKSGQNLLLTFTNVRNEAGKGNDVFNQATDDDARHEHRARHRTPRAVRDPTRQSPQRPDQGHHRALSRVGVSFTEGQKKQIKAMVKAGDTMGAQKTHPRRTQQGIRRLRRRPPAKTLAGKLDILKNTALNLGGTLAGIPDAGDHGRDHQVHRLGHQQSENQKRSWTPSRAPPSAVSTVGRRPQGRVRVTQRRGRRQQERRDRSWSPRTPRSRRSDRGQGRHARQQLR